jgi:predicted DNA-binding transcriptional regulator YafY
MNSSENKSVAMDSAMALPNVIARDYLTVEALARELGASPRTLMRWHALRMGPPRTVIGKKILYRIASVQTWLQHREERRAR